MSLLFRRSNGFYYLVTFHNGHRVWRSTRKRRRADAEKYLRDIVLQPDTSLGTTVLQNGMKLEDHWPLSVSFTGFIPQWRVYANTSFIRIVGDKPLNEYRAMDLEHYKSIRLNEVSPTKTNIDFTSIKVSSWGSSSRQGRLTEGIWF